MSIINQKNTYGLKSLDDQQLVLKCDLFRKSEKALCN